MGKWKILKQWPEGPDFDSTQRIACPCGKTVTLQYNGGEGDADTCSCGRQYETYVPKIYIRVKEKNG